MGNLWKCSTEPLGSHTLGIAVLESRTARSKPLKDRHRANYILGGQDMIVDVTAQWRRVQVEESRVSAVLHARRWRVREVVTKSVASSRTPLFVYGRPPWRRSYRRAKVTAVKVESTSPAQRKGLHAVLKYVVLMYLFHFLSFSSYPCDEYRFPANRSRNLCGDCWW